MNIFVDLYDEEDGAERELSYPLDRAINPEFYSGDYRTAAALIQQGREHVAGCDLGDGEGPRWCVIRPVTAAFEGTFHNALGWPFKRVFRTLDALHAWATRCHFPVIAVREIANAVPTSFADLWYECEVEDGFSDEVEPDWSRVPEAKRDTVRDKWRAAHVKTETGRWLLWGPQLPWYQRQKPYRITILRAVEAV
jgi:hypothetical protein